MDFWYKTERSARSVKRQIRLKMAVERPTVVAKGARQSGGLSLFSKALISAAAGGLVTLVMKLLVDLVAPLVAQHIK